MFCQCLKRSIIFVSVSLCIWSEETVCPHNILPRKKEPKPSIRRVLQIHLNSFTWHYHIFVAYWVWTRCPWKIVWILPSPNSCSFLVCRIQASLDLTFVSGLCQHWAWSLRKRTNPNKSTIMKCAKVRSAVPYDSRLCSPKQRCLCSLLLPEQKKSVVEPCNAEHFPKWPRCHHPGSVVPAVDIYYGHCLLVISHLKTHTSYDSASK